MQAPHREQPGHAAAPDPDDVLGEQVRGDVLDVRHREQRRGATAADPAPAPPGRRRRSSTESSPSAVARKHTRGARPLTPASSIANSVSGPSSHRTRRPGTMPPEVARMVGASAGTTSERSGDVRTGSTTPSPAGKSASCGQRRRSRPPCGQVLGRGDPCLASGHGERVASAGVRARAAARPRRLERGVARAHRGHAASRSRSSGCSCPTPSSCSARTPRRRSSRCSTTRTSCGCTRWCRTATAAVLVLDLADGGSLADLLAVRGRLTPGEVITALAPVAAALAYLHGAGRGARRRQRRQHPVHRRAAPPCSPTSASPGSPATSPTPRARPPTSTRSWPRASSRRRRATCSCSARWRCTP